MKQPSKPSNTPQDLRITQAGEHYRAAQKAVRKSCEHALLAGLRLISLHSDTVGEGHGGARTIGSSVSRDTHERGFLGAIAEIEMKRPTAYRWMNATMRACVRAGLIPADMDMEYLVGELPNFDSPRWQMWEDALVGIAQGMSLNRLMLGTSSASTEDHRYDELLSASEEGRQRGTDLLEGVAGGKYTLVQAARALGSLEAYDKLRSQGGEKVRKDPVYLTMDGATGYLDGLFVKSLTTLRNTFAHWDETPAPARKKARELWLEVIDAMPADLKHG